MCPQCAGQHALRLPSLPEEQCQPVGRCMLPVVPVSAGSCCGSCCSSWCCVGAASGISQHCSCRFDVALRVPALLIFRWPAHPSVPVPLCHACPGWYVCLWLHGPLPGCSDDHRQGAMYLATPGFKLSKQSAAVLSTCRLVQLQWRCFSAGAVSTCS